MADGHNWDNSSSGRRGRVPLHNLLDLHRLTAVIAEENVDHIELGELVDLATMWAPDLQHAVFAI